jgi:rhodanese-related sulfurtransferase
MKYLLIIITAALFVSCNSSNESKYALSLSETLNMATSKADVLSAKELANIILQKDTVNYIFVDIRTPQEYIVWHVSGAVNIPAKDIFSSEYQDILNNSMIKILYCKGSHQAMNTYTELKQLGYKNIKVSLGGYDFIKNHIIDTLSLKKGIYNEDTALYDYAKIVKETAGVGAVGNLNTKTTKKKIVKKRRKKGVEGGCG